MEFFCFSFTSSLLLNLSNLNNQGSRHKVVLIEKGLEVAEAILSERLDPIEQKAIEVSIKKKRRLKF